MNSNVKLQEVVDDAASLGDTAPALATGGVSDGPALPMATDVMSAMINGGPGGVPTTGSGIGLMHRRSRLSVINRITLYRTCESWMD